MKKYLWWGVFAIAVILLVVSIKENSEDNVVIKIGVVAPLSGDYAAAGENHVKGMQLASEIYSKEHPDSKVELIVEDDGFDASKGLSAFKKLTGIDHVSALLMTSSPVIDALHEIIGKEEIPVTNFGVQTDGVAADNIFQMSPAPEAPIAAFAEYINVKYSFKKIAVVYDATAYGVVFHDAFKKGYEGESDSFKIENKNQLKSYATKIAVEDYDAVVFLTSPENGALLFKDIQILAKKQPQYFFDAQLQTGFEDYKRILGNTKVLDGAVSVWIKGGQQDEFKKMYKEKYGEEPGFLADFGFDSFNTVMNAYDKDPKRWQENIQKTNTQGVSGDIVFDEQGVRVQDIVINEVKGGEIVVIEE
jgi:branched-chain amino acid transport system substrate-binding protein